MNNCQHIIGLSNLLLLFNGLAVLLKKAIVLCLNDEFTDSIRLISSKALYRLYCSLSSSKALVSHGALSTLAY